ncbi:unnamed protein product, partial [Symbiodinium microadriaticum]
MQVQVRCSKLKLNVSTGEKEADGHECFSCEEHRACAALPGARMSKEGFDISAYQEQTAYADKFIEAYWLPIDSFISEAGGDPKSFFNMAAKIHWVEKHCEQSISWDGGKPGVLKALHSDGRKRVNIGMRSGTTKRQEDNEIMGDLEACENVYEQASSSMERLADQVCNIDTVRQTLALKADDSDAADSLIQALPAPSDSKELRMRFGLFDAPDNDQGQAALSGSKGSGRGKPPSKHPTTSRDSAGSAKRQRTDGVPPPADGGALPSAPNQTRKTLETMRKAREALQKQDVTFADTSIWGSKLRRRALDAAVKSLSTHAATLLATNDTDAVMLSTQISEWCSKAETRFEALQAARTKPLEVAGTASEEMTVHMDTLKNMQVPMLSNIILHIAGECLKSADKEATQVQGTERFFAVASCKMDTGLTVGTVFAAAQRSEHRDAPDMPASLAANLQSQLVALWYDRIMRMKNTERFRQLINACPVPRLELYRVAADWKPPKQDIDSSGNKCFTTIIRFDVQVLRLMSMQDWQQASPIDVLLAKTAVDLRPQLSMRLQTFMRSGTGAAGKQLINKTSHWESQQLWALMEQASKRALSPASVAAEVNAAADELPQDPATKLDRAIAASESLKAMPQVPEVSPEKAAALKQVLPVAEQLFVCTEGLLGEVLVAHSSVMAAFKNTSPETFAVAVRAMNKLACTSRVADVKLQIDRVSEGGSNE